MARQQLVSFGIMAVVEPTAAAASSGTLIPGPVENAATSLVDKGILGSLLVLTIAACAWLVIKIGRDRKSVV